MNLVTARSNLQPIESLAAVAAFQVVLCPMAACVASEMLSTAECIVALETLEGTLKLASVRPTESAGVESRV